MLAKKEAVYFCIVLLITKCMLAEIRGGGDEKLLIDLEWPNASLVPGLSHVFQCLHEMLENMGWSGYKAKILHWSLGFSVKGLEVMAKVKLVAVTQRMLM